MMLRSEQERESRPVTEDDFSPVCDQIRAAINKSDAMVFSVRYANHDFVVAVQDGRAQLIQSFQRAPGTDAHFWPRSDPSSPTQRCSAAAGTRARSGAVSASGSTKGRVPSSVHGECAAAAKAVGRGRAAGGGDAGSADRSRLSPAVRGILDSPGGHGPIRHPWVCAPSSSRASNRLSN